jgi:hypothetical protein
MIPLFERQAKRFLDAPGIGIILTIWPESLVTNGSSRPSFIETSSFPSSARLYHPKEARGCGPFHTKITLAKEDYPKLFRRRKIRLCGITQNSYREISISLYGKTRPLRLAKFIGKSNGLGKVAIVGIKEKRGKPLYLVSTNLYLSAIDVLKYYDKRWNIEQMIKNLKQRPRFGDYQGRTLKAIEQHVALLLLSYFVLVLLKVLQWLRDKKQALDLSICCLAFQLRRHILSESISLSLRSMRIRFNQIFSILS